jgi:RNA polymerase sigma-70 factor, ECF subfamily
MMTPPSPLPSHCFFSSLAAPPDPEDEVVGAPCGAVTAESVFREHGDRVFSLARRMVDNDADAEDVTQEVLVQVVRKLDTFRGEAALTTWLHRVTVNAALALRRRRAARRERPLGATPEHTLEDSVAPARDRRRASPDEQALGRELRQVIESAIQRLPRLYRDTYVLADVDGLSNAEVGATLGLSLPAVKSRLHRARLMMRDALAPFFEEPPT